MPDANFVVHNQRCDLFRIVNFLKRFQARVASIDARLAALEARLPSPAERESESRSASLLIASWVARSYYLRGLAPYPAIAKRAATVGPTIEEAWFLMEALEPAVFPLWKELYENGQASYTGDTTASCSHWDNKYARLFGGFVGLFAHGQLLDIGCGLEGRPTYLAGYPNRLISGLDPRANSGAVDFEYVQGFNEFLPWPDDTFQTVVSGTSLDHVLSLEKSLDEVRRVLAAEGIYLIWLASVPGARAYIPQAENFAPADKFHLFHFDRKWVEPVFERYFSIEEICVIAQAGFDHVFYCLRNTK